MLRRPIVRQFSTFVVVGAINAVLDGGLYFLLLQTPLGGFGQLGKQLAKAGSFVVAVASSYLMNRHYTFRVRGPADTRQAAKFFLVSAVGLGLNNLAFFIATAQFGLPDLWALVVTTGLVGIWNFSANKWWTFREAA